MKNINNVFKLIIISLIIITCINLAHAQKKSAFEKIEPFYPVLKEAADANEIVTGFLSVPETWNGNQKKKIKIATTILRNNLLKENAQAIVFLQGGPGASGVQSIWSWINHPLRENNDIILLDIRGTGYSEPRLCPDLGEDFLKIIAKNQSEEEDEIDKKNAALLCKQEIINKGINIEAYNSISVAKDLHALKEELNYKKWVVYGVSYGTHMAQVYAENFPEDIKSLILDSSIDDISTYYVSNTSNYMGSLKKVFELCKNDEKANKQYPNLESVYYKVIADLDKNPLTVLVDKEIVSSGSFTYNLEDFKVAIQQALYNKQLVEVIPLLIYQFHRRDSNTLGNLVSSFSSLLKMDYGLYYCVSCNEVLPNNDFSKYVEKSNEYTNLDGGIAFYESDFYVCDAWNNNSAEILKPTQKESFLSDAKYPVLIFAGEFDPITPQGNGIATAAKFKNSYNIKADTYGHTPSFTQIGTEITKNFVNIPSYIPDVNAFKKAKKITLVKDIVINKGVSKMGNSFDQLDPVFITPLIIALGMMLIFIFIYGIKLLKKSYKTAPDRIIRIAIILMSILGLIILISLVIALLNVSKQNYFILAFGLPQEYNYIFTLSLVFLITLMIITIYYIFSIKKIRNRSILFSIMFSNGLLAIYLLYWGIIGI